MVDEKKRLWTKRKYKLFLEYCTLRNRDDLGSGKGYIFEDTIFFYRESREGHMFGDIFFFVGLKESGTIPRKLECLLIALGES